MTQIMSGSSSADEIAAADIEEEAESEEPSSTEESPSESIPLDQIFGILKNRRRRHVLRYLYEAEEPVSLSEVAEQIAAWENDKEVRQISSSERKRVYVGLYQCHLPKMDGAGVVSFNKPRGIIELGENAGALYTYLDVDDKTDESSWSEYSMALSLGGAVVLASGLLLRPMTTVPILDVAVVLVVSAFLVYSLANFSRVRSDETDGEN